MAEISLSEYANQPHTPKKQGISTLPRAPLLIAGAIVIVAAASFLGGVQYQKGKTPKASTTESSYQNSTGSRGNFRGGNRAFGTVTAVSSSSISVQTRGGGTSTYDVTSSTTVTDNGQSSSVSAIQTGDTVMLTLNSSNTKDVSSIMVNPSLGGFGGGFNGGAGSSNTGSNTDSQNSTGSDTDSSTTTVGA